MLARISIYQKLVDYLLLWKRRVEVDSAVFYILLAKVWGIPSAVVTMLLLARCLSPDDQGYYYTFGSILGLSIFFELGFFLVILNVTSNEYSQLTIGEDKRLFGNTESLSRLVSLGRLCFKWYAVAGILFILSVVPAGYIFFSQKVYANVVWQIPWFCVVVLSGLNFLASPFLTILEGCNQVAAINRVRLYQGVCGSLILWGVLLLDGKLWSLVISGGVSLLFNCYVIFVKYKPFFEAFLMPPSGARINWRTEVWPMQWRISLSGLVNYFVFSLFNPLMFHYFGPVVAGQMGMTRSVVGAVQGVGMAWVSAKTPLYGILVGKKDYSALDRLWFKVSLISVIVVTIGAAFSWSFIVALNQFGAHLAGRFLDPISTGLFLLTVPMTLVSQSQAAYLRAHVQEPIVFMSVSLCLLSGVLVWQFGKRFGPIGAAAANLAVWTLVLIWMTHIWRSCRREWHKEGANAT